MKNKHNIKTMSVKVRSTEAKLQLYHIIKEYNETAAFIENKIMAMSGRTLCDRDGKVVLDSSDEIAKTAKIAGVVSSAELMTHTKGFYKNFTESKMPRGFVSFLTQNETSASNEHADVLRKLGFFPLSHQGQKYDLLDAQGGYKYAVIGSIHQRMSSWIECDVATTKEWHQLKDEINKKKEEISKIYSEDVLIDLDNFLEEIKSFNFPLGKTAKKFASFFEHNLLPSFKERKPVSYGTWTTTSGKSVDYFCPEAVVQLLYKKYRILWDSDAPILASKEFFNYVELYYRFQNKRQFASFTQINLLNSSVCLLNGNNYVALKRKTGFVADCEKKTITVTMKYPKSLTEDNSKKWLVVPCTYNRKNTKQRGYFENLTITPILNKVGREAGTYIFEYKINGKRPRRAFVKEPRFRFVQRKFSMNVENPKVTDFDIYLDFPMDVEVQPCHKFETKDLWNIRKTLSTAFPEIKDFGRQKTISKNGEIDLKKIITASKTLKTMSIDLGLRNPFAYSVHEWSKNGKHTLLNSGVLSPSTENKMVIAEYKDFRNACYNVRKLIASTRYYHSGQKTSIDSCWLNFLNLYFSKHIKGYVTHTIEDYIKWNEKHKKVQTPLIEFKRDNKWILKEITSRLKEIVDRLTKERLQNNHFTTHYEWIAAQDCYIRAVRSFQTMGVDSRTVKQSGIPFRKRKDSINNLKIDYMKKLAFEIAELAKSNGVAIVVTEKLDGLRGSVYNDKDRNQLFNAWPVGQIKHYIENALANYGILTAEADERHTSQIVHDTGDWGYRDEKNGNLLWSFDKTGKIYAVHADENAAKNIGLRYLSRHTTQNSIRLTKLDDGGKFYVPATSKRSATEDGGKRERGFLSRSFGTSRPVFELKGEFLVLSKKKTFKDFSKQIKKDSDTETEMWYFTDNKFKKLMTRDMRDLLEKQIEDAPKP